MALGKEILQSKTNNPLNSVSLQYIPQVTATEHRLHGSWEGIIPSFPSSSTVNLDQRIETKPNRNERVLEKIKHFKLLLKTVCGILELSPTYAERREECINQSHVETVQRYKWEKIFLKQENEREPTMQKYMKRLRNWIRETRGLKSWPREQQGSQRPNQRRERRSRRQTLGLRVSCQNTAKKCKIYCGKEDLEKSIIATDLKYSLRTALLLYCWLPTD